MLVAISRIPPIRSMLYAAAYHGAVEGPASP